MFRAPDLKRILSIVMPGYKKLKAEFFADVPATGTSTTAAATSLTSAVTGADTGTPAVDATSSGSTLALILSILLFLGTSFLLSFGAARLSWCYNMYVGNPTGISIFYGFLAWTFAGFYYPFYAWFLNPVCSFKKPTSFMGGGRRR